MKKTLSILQKMKDKLSDIWDEITYYIYDLPKHWFLSIRGWYRIYCKNPYYWKEMKYTFNENAPWDSIFFYKSQYLWLQKSIYYFENKCKHIDEKQIAFIVASQKLALKMLDIYLENIELWDLEEDINADKSLPYYQRHNYKCIPYVNLRNKHRYKYFALDTVNYDKIVYADDMYNIEPHELYRQKAIRLYHKIIAKYSNTWWD